MKFLFIIMILTLSACRQAVSLDTSGDFTLEINFVQSLSTPIKFQIDKSGNGATLYFTKTVFNSGPPFSKRTDTAILSEAALQDFLDQIKNVPFFSLSSDTASSIGDTDGQTTRVSIVQDQRKHQFAFDNPSRKNHPQYYAVLDAAFELMYRHFNKDEAEIADNQEKLDYGLRIKQSGDNPLVVRTYGSYFKHAKAAQDYLSHLPRDRNVIVDLSNMVTVAFIADSLAEIETKHPRLAWVLGPTMFDDVTKQDMINRGCDSHRIFRDSASASLWLSQKH